MRPSVLATRLLPTISSTCRIGINGRLSNRSPRGASPHLLAVLAVIDGDIVVEQALHRRFANARIRREWFRPVPELLAYIAEIKARAA